MADPKIEDRSDEMEDDLHKLEDHIADAEKKVEARRKDADITGDVAGDWEGEQDRGGGDDPQGAARDAEQGDQKQDDDATSGDANDRDDDRDDRKQDDADANERDDEEYASPT